MKKLKKIITEKSEGDKYRNVWSFLCFVLKLIERERFSLAGKVNLISDIFILVFFICILIATSINTVSTVIQNIFAMFTKSEINSLDFNVLIICFIIFVISSFACLLFMHFTSKNEDLIDSIKKDK